MQDKSWRVRYNVAQQLCQLCEALGPDLARYAAANPHMPYKLPECPAWLGHGRVYLSVLEECHWTNLWLCITRSDVSLVARYLDMCSTTCIRDRHARSIQSAQRSTSCRVCEPALAQALQVPPWHHEISKYYHGTGRAHAEALQKLIVPGAEWCPSDTCGDICCWCTNILRTHLFLFQSAGVRTKHEGVCQLKLDDSIATHLLHWQDASSLTKL